MKERAEKIRLHRKEDKEESQWLMCDRGPMCPPPVDMFGTGETPVASSEIGNGSDDKRQMQSGFEQGNQLTIPKKVRLLFWGGARADNDNNTFEEAADNTTRDYKDVVGTKVPIAGARDIIEGINHEDEGTVESVDIFAHSSAEQVYFANNEWIGDNDLYKDDNAEKDEAGHWWNDSGNLEEIRYSVFSTNVKVEFHGCKAASIEDKSNGDNLASNFSKKLFDAGKTNAVVIGHVTKSNPDKHETLVGSDYRHGGRRVYHNGEILFFTRKEGIISTEEIHRFLEMKTKEGKSYDGRHKKL